MSSPSVEISEGIATITFNRPDSLNAITREDYDALAAALWAIDKRDDVVATIWQATGRWFCAGTSVHKSSFQKSDNTVRNQFLDNVSRANTDVTKALYSHSKILVVALNGPVMGIAAGFIAQADFIYAVPEAWLSVPFAFLGLITEAGSSVEFARRMGVAKANETLIFGKKKEAQELLECGFYNKVFPSQPISSFHAAVRRHVKDELEELVPEAVLKIKQLIRTGFNEQNNYDATNLRESYGQAERLATGVPAQRFDKIARKEIKHKL